VAVQYEVAILELDLARNQKAAEQVATNTQNPRDKRKAGWVLTEIEAVAKVGK
jgi:hypothetical protein